MARTTWWVKFEASDRKYNLGEMVRFVCCNVEDSSKLKPIIQVAIEHDMPCYNILIKEIKGAASTIVVDFR
ncbi:hypothetical protein CMI37_04470 [Candidatus Pacearchaeota archaeon]|nr:hypothetical protein [Candidatus Pacearchaeota archaeon]|tara:strand:+ start:1844 stop:2056 length:213 start_codon:yes stop_codon:yes gene_type:complete